MPIPISTLKSAIIDTVAGGDLPLAVLLQDNIDLLWSLNQRRSTAQPIQFFYTLADALRMGMEFVRSNIDNAQTDSDSLAVRRGREFSTRNFQAQNASSGFTTVSINGSSADDETRTRLSDLTSTSHEHNDHRTDGSTTGRDRSVTSASVSRDTGESMLTSETETNFVTGSQAGNTDYEATTSINAPMGSITGDVHSFDVNATVFGTAVRFGYRDGSSHSYLNSNADQNGRVFAPNGNLYSNYQQSYTDTLIDGTATVTGRGTLQNGLAELGSGSHSVTRDVHNSGSLTVEDHANRSTTHIASNSVHGLATIIGSQVNISDGHSVTSSSASDLSHGEKHEVGESNEQMTATIDYMGQLFDNLARMYRNVMEQIKAFEPQIAVGQRYALTRMTAKRPVQQLPAWAFFPSGVN